MDMLSSNSVLSFTGIWFMEPFNLFSFKFTNSNCTFIHTYIHRWPSECILIIIVIKSLHHFFSSWLSLTLPYRYTKYSHYIPSHIFLPLILINPLSITPIPFQRFMAFGLALWPIYFNESHLLTWDWNCPLQTSGVTSGYTAEGNASTFAWICN